MAKKTLLHPQPKNNPPSTNGADTPFAPSNETDTLFSQAALGDFLRLPDVMKTTGKSRSSIFDDIKLGMFPRPVRIGKRATAWVQEEILAWKQKRIQQHRVQQ